MSYFKVIIPARYDSTRLPGKILADICGKPMIQRTYEKAIELIDPENVFIATDSVRVIKVAQKFGAQCILTSKDHKSGTERLLEASSQLNLLDNEIIVNMQADEPLLPPKLLEQVANNLWQNSGADVATLYDNIITEEDLHNPAIVKVVIDQNNFALYFSRAPIPFHRDGINREEIGKRHIGLYAYRVETLRRYSQEFSPCHLEQTEMLEQLRLLYHGRKIHVCLAQEIPMFGIDTQEDLDDVRLAISLRGLKP